MTSITARNRAALAAKNGTTIPEQPKAPAKAKATKEQAPVVVPEIPKAAPTGVPCHCGCRATAKPGRSYLPGHDAKHAGQIGRALAAKAEGAEQAAAALPPKLQAKARAFADNAAKREAKKTAARELRAKMEAELKAKLAELDAK